MLEKNKDYIEMRVSSTDFAFTQNEPVRLCVEGLVDATNGRFPGPGEDYILISKDKFEALQTENEQRKKKLAVPDPLPEFRELLEKLYSKDDAGSFEWTLNHICGGQASVNGWMVSAKLWRQNYETLSKLVGFSSTEEIQDYLTNEANCDTLHGAISKLRDEVTYTCEKLASANSENNSWKATAECNSPKELMAKLNLLRDTIEHWHDRTTDIENLCADFRDHIEAWKEATGCDTPEEVKETIQKWKEMTKCETPEAAATWITSYESACKRGNNLYSKIEAWKEVTCCDTPEEAKNWAYKLGEANGSLAKAVLSWREITGFNTPEKCGSYIDTLERDCKEAIKKCKKWGEVTGFETPEEAKDYWTAKLSESGEVSESLAREVRSWKNATGCDTPEEANKKLASYEGRLDSVKQSASIAIRLLDNIVFRDDKCTDWSDK